ncbi:MAG: DUF58 domain-containing protein [Oscillospiraceae bacterium]|nr:DUF58 domain-containing protein [Oscillospiraceae bacterium]MCL2227387.1 DUF58 domain-containing protein [Oscillospiraceae bacterium]
MLALLIIIAAVGLVLEAISLKRDPGKVDVDFKTSTHRSEPGAPFNVQTVVSNRSFVPISYLAIIQTYSLHAALPSGLDSTNKIYGVGIKKNCRVGGRRKKKLILQTSVEKRGLHSFSAESIEFGDFLGFYEFKKHLYIRHDVVVYPKRLESPALTDALSKFCGDVASKRFLIRDPVLTIGTREYTGREPMKEIHWLKSAQRGELMVKEFDFNREFSVSVLMNVDGVSYQDDEELDSICSMARTVCQALADAGASVTFFANALRRGSRGGSLWKCEASKMHAEELLEGLGRVTCLDNGKLDDLTAYALRESSLDSAYILILPNGDERATEASRMLRENTNQEVMVIRPGDGA